MTDFPTFAQFFREVRGFEPYDWQERAAAAIADGNPPSQVLADTGMGKTDLITAWVWALARDLARTHRAGGRRVVPLRLHFVVDRRIVVDDTTKLAEKIAAALETSANGSAAKAVREALGQQLAVVCMRGGLKTKAEHTRQITQPTVVSTTLDLFGSRLLWRGYTTSRSRRPIDAALTGADTLIVLDEVHLIPQLMQTLADLDLQAQHETWLDTTVPPRRVITATATPALISSDALRVNAEKEYAHNPTLRRTAINRDAIAVQVAERPLLAEALALAPTSHGEALLVAVNTVKQAMAVTGALVRAKTTARVVTLIGGMPEPARKDTLDVLTPYFTRASGRAEAAPLIVVATQTLEVGVDLDFDNMVTEASAYDSFIQRTGRVNRLGDRTGCRVVVVAPDGVDFVYGVKAPALLSWLVDKPTLGAVKQAFDAEDDKALLISDQLPPRRLPQSVFNQWLDTDHDECVPPVGSWLRPAQKNHQINVVFRDPLADPTLTDRGALAYVTNAPPAEWETWSLSVSTWKDIALDGRRAVAVRSGQGTLIELTKDVNLHSLIGATLVVGSQAKPALAVARFGTDLSGERLLDEPLTHISGAAYDDLLELGADLPSVVSEARWESDGDEIALDDTHWLFRLPSARAQEAEAHRQALDDHHLEVAQVVKRNADALGLPETITVDLVLAAAHHDEGKRHPGFQSQLHAIRKHGRVVVAGDDVVLAKSAVSGYVDRKKAAQEARKPENGALPDGFRHEALSVAIVDNAWIDDAHNPDLVRYLIATHHGQFHGCGPVVSDHSGLGEISNDYQNPTTEQWSSWPDKVAALRARYGPYSLALMEAILRLADWECSAATTERTLQ